MEIREMNREGDVEINWGFFLIWEKLAHMYKLRRKSQLIQEKKESKICKVRAILGK